MTLYDDDDSGHVEWPPQAAAWYGERSSRFRPPPASENPYVRFGDTRRLRFTSLQTLQQVEFQRVTLPRPALCRVQYHVQAKDDAPGASVEFTSITYTVGVGSSATAINRVYLAQPQVPTVLSPEFGTPLDVDMYMSIENLYTIVSARAVNCTVSFTMMLAPVALEDIRPLPGGGSHA